MPTAACSNSRRKLRSLSASAACVLLCTGDSPAKAAIPGTDASERGKPCVMASARQEDERWLGLLEERVGERAEDQTIALPLAHAQHDQRVTRAPRLPQNRR